jgi:uncharacterized coiled-coil protein SlyX
LADEVTLVDDESQQGNPVEPGPEERDPGEVDAGVGGEESPGGTGEPESLLAEKDEELAQASARIADLEETVASRDSEIGTLKQSAAELEERLAVTSGSLADTVARYRDMVIQANPGVLEELVGGDGVEAVDASLQKAKNLIGKVREGLEAEVSLGRVPAGAPERRPPDLSALSPREKIQYGIGGRR